jgi:dipeptidyl aminopeptidase/acylaminoacyl peptidase
VDFQEIMIGVEDLLARQEFVDGERMGVTGGSCGGVLTNWIVGHTDRFKAAVTQRSITNYVSRIGSSDTGPLHVLSELRTHPWEDLEFVWRMSAIAYAPQVNTPLLIIHSDEDHRCPIEQAEEFFTVLRWMGKEVEFCWFEGESHNLSRLGRPSNRVERLRRIVGWFRKYLGSGPAAAAVLNSWEQRH